MSVNSYRFNYLPKFLGGTAVVTAIVISQPVVVFAKSAPEINQIAEQTTVQINNNQGSTGGTGVIIAKQGNTYTVLTANHVVCDAIPDRNPIICRDDVTYTIRTNTGKEYPLKRAQRLQKNNNDPDLAVVTFESDRDYPIATIGDSKQAVTGSQIYVFGYPTSDGRSGAQRESEFSPGFVTSRPDSRPQGYTLRYNAVTQRGMSGGPVFDSEGRVVGIHGQGGKDGELESRNGTTVAIKSGWNAAIPINTFMAQKSQAGLSSLSLTVNNRPTDEKQAQINNPSNARDYYALGSVRYEQGDSRGAIEAYTQVLQRNPDKSEAFFAYFNQGNIRFQQGDYQGALEDYTAAIQKNPDAAIAYNNRAVARIRLADYQGAVEDWTQASQRGAKDASTYYNRGVAYSRLGNQQAAIADYTKALQIDRKYAPAYNSRGNVLADLGDKLKALEDYKQAIEVNPGFADAYNNRAILRAAQGDRTGAIEDLQKAAQLLMDRGKTAQYQQVMENLRRLQR
ncbi:tetratricopeptide repeat-containing serine protease family protein [Scytonema sp. PRP1]|uniref:tetratricopeptide repeat-containing serine protease family protein n=1 Tax=Scytonema sp. PRP1 TaxID=3120513 RepID=UPI00300C0EFA